ncbi:hypothetical protein Bca52824_083734 [Brassica carinata]|uniref:MIP18 family-like domain-containing protein n=1 Tax=Brassica carinata TaxID=52824 RepID=A0A8X7PMT4_BRACI|nr:hypothetical protein Bca52824_083734 [Brassica carinata]
MVSGLINENPIVYERKERVRDVRTDSSNTNELSVDAIDQLEVFDILIGSISHHIRDIKDPEHPYSLEQLKVLTEDSVEVDDTKSHVRVTFTPTVEHCSMATIIGLCVRVKLMRSLLLDTRQQCSVFNGSFPLELFSSFQIDIRVAPVLMQLRLQSIALVNRHLSFLPMKNAVNKQLNDKERVAAALENPNLVEMVDECLSPSFE